MDGRNGDVPESLPAGSPPETESDTEDPSGKWFSIQQISGWRDHVLPPSGPTAAAAFLTAVALFLGLGMVGYFSYQAVQEGQHQLQATAQKFSDPLYWPANQVRTLDATFHLATKWVPKRSPDGTPDYSTGKIKYKLRIEGYPDPLQNAWRSDLSSSYFLTVRLLDEDDFRILAVKIPLDEMVRTLNPRGEGIGFSTQGSETMALRTYRQIDDWKVNWNL